jgi:outer membrane murein-binding lipoprotein Lpp
MRKLAAVVVGCLMLAGCAASWQGDEVRYRIKALDNSTPTEYFDLELVGSAPKGALDATDLARKSVRPSEVSGGAAVGDEVLCLVEQKKGSAIGDSHVVSLVKSCKKA